MEEKNHIYPIFDRMMTRQDKEELLGTQCDDLVYRIEWFRKEHDCHRIGT